MDLSSCQAHSVQLSPQNICLTGARKVHHAILLIDRFNGLDDEGTLRQGLQSSARFIDVELPESSALICPQELASLADGFQHVVHVNPQISLLYEQHLGGSVFWVQTNDSQLGLLSVQHLADRSAIWHPLQPGKVKVLTKGACEVDLLWGRWLRALCRWRHEEPHLGVLCTSEGVVVILLGTVSNRLRAAVHDSELVDVGFIDLLIDYLLPVGREPVAFISIQLLLRQEVGQAVRLSSVSSAGG
mmetsp:Transcript_89762/g.187540  ORF Transcript_89762/g.187540 Transcript_89762/m.187540 type:complete len:244 (+) Transcript_89762:1088-1819(+)